MGRQADPSRASRSQRGWEEERGIRSPQEARALFRPRRFGRPLRIYFATIAPPGRLGKAALLLFVSTLFILLLALGPGSACLAPSTPHRARSNGMAGGTATGRTGAPPTTAEMIRIQRDCRNAARRRQPAGVRAFPLPSGAGPAGQAPPEAGPRAATGTRGRDISYALRAVVTVTRKNRDSEGP